MRLRQEQVVCLGAVVLLGFLVYRGTSEGNSKASRARPTQAPEFVPRTAPDTALALPRDPRTLADMDRALFEPPRDTEPLPPLELEPPPLQPLAALRPPGSRGPAPDQYGRLLRVGGGALSTPLIGLFDDIVAEEVDLEAFEAIGDLGADDEDLTAEERMERIASYKRLYDWIKTPSYRWGQIRNADRFGLEERDQEAVEWIEINPLSGSPRYPGQPAVSYARERIDAFGFADTLENRIELEKRAFGGQLTPGKFSSVLAFADWCTLQRLGAPNALSTAEELYTKALDISGGDPAPHLGLARCYEAGFQFEKAFDVYSRLIEGDFGDHPGVLAQLARLEDRFRLYERAEEHFAKAERYGRSNWQVAWLYGRHDLERGDLESALTRLSVAGRQEPVAPEYVALRAAIRSDLGHAHLAAGDTAAASSWYVKALQAQPDTQEALAGLMTLSYLQGPNSLNGSASLLEEQSVEGSGAELLLARGLVALSAGEFADAREKLELAAETDPLRAGRAWRALSYLAEITGNSEEALRFADLAHENDPSDCYTLIQRGRVLAGRDDLVGALASFKQALDQELELPDVLANMGAIEFEQGNHERAELFFERSLFLDEEVGGVHTQRGLNQLALGRATEAETSFKRARRFDRTDPVAKNGLAWCAYVLGDSVEAQTLFRELDDERRALPEDDPHRLYALAQIERISDHQEKVVWKDLFERQEVQNGWAIEGEDTGVTIGLEEGTLVFEGTFNKIGRARVKREYNSGDFVSAEVKVTVDPGTRVRVGASISLETYRRGEWDVSSEVSLSRHQDGVLQTRFLRSGKNDIDYTDVEGFPWNLGEPITLRIQRYGESSDTRFRLEVDGIAVVEDIPVPTMGRSSGKVFVSLFVEGEPGRPVRAVFDNVEIVKRDR